MKLSEHLKHQRENPEYLQAEKDLQFRLQIANAIIDSRIIRGWSQSDLAERIGTKQANISRIEAGIANPTVSLLEKIFNILDIRFQIWGSTYQIDNRPSIQAITFSQNKTGKIGETTSCEVNYSVDSETPITPIAQGTFL